MSELNKVLDDLVESQVEASLQADPYYEFLSTPLKPASSIKKEHREQLTNFFKMTELRSHLEMAQNLILALLPDLISPQQFAKVKNEIDNSGAHFLQFIESQNDEPSETPILFQEMFGLSDDTILHIYDLGVSLIGNKKMQEAIIVFTFLTTLAPHVSSYWVALGVCFQETNRHQDAITAFSAAKFLKPMDPAPLFYTIESYLLLKETEKANLELEELKNVILTLSVQSQEEWRQKIKSLMIS